MVEHKRKLRRAHHWRSLGLALCAALLGASVPVHAADVWIVRGNAGARAGDCPGVRWSADALLHNRSAASAAVRVLHVSNGGDSLPEGTVPANGSISAGAAGVGGTANAGLWVTKLDLPSTIAVEGRLEYFAVDCAVGHPPAIVPAGKLSLPVVRALIPPAEEQVHFGTDLGGQTVRLNVAIYNASTQPANAVIVVRQPVCRTTPVATFAFIPADSIVQVAIPRVEPCTTETLSPGWASYVTVTVDQPSFSFVSALSSTQPIGATTAVVP